MSLGNLRRARFSGTDYVELVYVLNIASVYLREFHDMSPTSWSHNREWHRQVDLWVAHSILDLEQGWLIVLRMLNGPHEI